MNYKCKRCLYSSKYFSDIKRHLTKKKLCSKNLDAYNYTDEELLKLSMIPYYDHKQNIDMDLIKNKNEHILTKEALINLLNSIDKKKIKICEYCNKEHGKIQELKNHIILECVSIQDLVNVSINNDHNKLNLQESSSGIIINNNTINNNTINNSINANINNININVKLDSVLSFDKNWDITHLNTSEKQALFISMYKYTKTLEYILKNETNLNVLVDKDSNKGFVYNNNCIEEMSVDEIVDKSFNKIYNNLNDFYNDIQNNNDFGISNDLLDSHKDSIQQKFNCFYENEDTRKIVKSCISETLDKVKDKTKENFCQLDINNSKIIGY